MALLAPGFKIKIINPVIMAKELNESEIIQHSHEWLNDHGHPSYSYLRKLANDDHVESRDELESLADQYNISYGKSTTVQELVDKIRLFMDLGADSA
jgi:hypothetical protein